MKKTGVRGVKVPVKKQTGKKTGSKKHSCPDCTFCQLCNDEKCAMCRPSKPQRSKKQHKKHKPLFCRF